MRIQERIRRARRRARFSHTRLAAAFDVRRSAVSNWESANETLPSMQNLLSIAKACRVSLEWLGTGRGGISTDTEALAEVPAADADLVDVEEERPLLAGFRNVPRRSQQLVLDLVETLQSGMRRSVKG